MHTGNPSNGEKVAEIRLKSISVHTKKRMHKTSGQFISIYFSLYSQNSAPNYHATIQTPYGTPLLGFPVPIKMATRSACWIFTGTFFLVFQAVVLIRPGPYFLHYLAPNLFEYICIVAETGAYLIATTDISAYSLFTVTSKHFPSHNRSLAAAAPPS